MLPANLQIAFTGLRTGNDLDVRLNGRYSTHVLQRLLDVSQVQNFTGLSWKGRSNRRFSPAARLRISHGTDTPGQQFQRQQTAREILRRNQNA
ncbi:hypothetical protein HGR_11032 [Hylemonella gracilis ATCC 19624]|uniref:Uncharacterized protein n=1 Tax=Hylemonella gracilis ATCC 19624 TaxID=887062 RepID=F3KUS2_9BURK|nr:hypothetical protein HGR_11032 [Hylemonella gracilis ATCC 19624]